MYTNWEGTTKNGVSHDINPIEANIVRILKTETVCYVNSSQQIVASLNQKKGEAARVQTPRLCFLSKLYMKGAWYLWAHGRNEVNGFATMMR